MNNTTITRPAVQVPRQGIVRRMRNRVAGLLVALGMLAGFGASPASAAGLSPAETAINGGFAELTGLVSGTLAVALFGLVVLIIGIVMGVRWLKRGAQG